MPVITPLSAAFSLAVIKAYLGVPSAQTNGDQKIADMAAGVTAAAEDRIKRRIVKRGAALEWIGDACGRARLHLPTYPTTVSAVATRDAVGYAWQAWDADAWEHDADQGAVFAVDDVFPSGARTVKVTHAPGFDVQDGAGIPPSLMKALKDWVKFAYTRDAAGLIVTTTSSMGGQSVSAAPEPPKDILREVDRYAKRRVL